MATSPVHQIPVIDQADDVFERLAKCDRLLTARERASVNLDMPGKNKKGK
jgi:hypothetical protein